MKKEMLMLAAATLLICTAPCGRTEPAQTPANTSTPQVTDPNEIKGDAAREHKNNEQAAVYYQAALRTSRQNALLYNKLGIVQLQLGQRSQARKSFAQALKRDPKLAPALNNLGAIALLDKKNKAAVGYFKQALAIDELNAHIHVNLAEAWIALGQIDHAMTEYARALELNSDVLSSSPDGVQAQVKTPGQRARISYMIAKAYMKRGNLDGALDYLGRAKELHYADLDKVYSDPDFTPLWNDPRLAKIVKRPAPKV
jgi:tetratricopeptide (TPR) repeat protein